MAMNPRLLRPTASRRLNPEAQDWINRVYTNGGTVSQSTANAVSAMCDAIESAGIRDRFYRLNLFCGDNLNAALVPLYRGPTFGGTTYGNATDTNNAFVGVGTDYAETGASSGLKGNGTSKYINTGLAANLLTMSDTHLGCGLRATQTVLTSYRNLFGVYNGASNALELNSRRDDATRNCVFTRFATASDTFGEQVQSTALAVGDVVAAWPTFYRDGVASGTAATTSQDYPSAHNIYVFALNLSGTSTLAYTDARINWYSIGRTMTSDQVLSFYNAIDSFNTSLNRT